MIDKHDPKPEIWTLFDVACNGTITAEQVERLEAVLRADEDACNLYLGYFRLHAQISRLVRMERCHAKVLESIRQPDKGTPAPVADPSDGPRQPAAGIALPVPGFFGAAIHGTVGYFSSGWPLAYLVATVIFGIGLAVGSLIHVSQPEQVARQSVPLPSPLSPLPSVVGRITGMADCQFVEGSGFRVQGSGLPSPAGRGAGGEGGSDGLHPSSFIPHPSSLVSLGDKFTLASGLMEITYDTGAKVILQGPVTYEVESRAGGYISVGKLTARVENAKQQAAISKFPNFQISKLFVVKTPTATVTDLGTEFGVCVDESGSTDADVFRGAVEVRAKSVENGTENVVRLTENQSARVRVNEHRVVTVSHSKATPEAFVCRMPPPPRRMAVKVFNTGAGVKEGDPDPHWQIVAASNDPKFQPRAAIVTSARPIGWLDNEAGQSQWISLDAGTAASNGVTYTFRTSFDLAGVAPETALLNGWFAVDNHVRAIRLNGNEVPVPDHGYDDSYSRYYRFTARGGFVAGSNILEIEVENGTPGAREPLSPMGVRVDLEATARSK